MAKPVREKHLQWEAPFKSKFPLPLGVFCLVPQKRYFFWLCCNRFVDFLNLDMFCKIFHIVGTRKAEGTPVDFNVTFVEVYNEGTSDF